MSLPPLTACNLFWYSAENMEPENLPFQSLILRVYICHFVAFFVCGGSFGITLTCLFWGGPGRWLEGFWCMLGSPGLRTTATWEGRLWTLDPLDLWRSTIHAIAPGFTQSYLLQYIYVSFKTETTTAKRTV